MSNPPSTVDQSQSPASSIDQPHSLPPPQVLFQLGTGYIASSALQVAARLKIADRLAAGPCAVGVLAAEAGVQPDPLYRVLRTLAGFGIFHEGDAQTFSATPVSELLRSDVPGSLYSMMLWITDPLHFRVYAELMHSLRTGQPAVEQVVGLPIFEYFARDGEISAVFNDAMTSFSQSVVAPVLRTYDFGGIERLVDVAGGHGELLMSILREYPSMRGVLFDVDHVIAGARPRIQAAGLTNRCETSVGDFFKAVPTGGDCYLMKHIIHDWDDDRALVILKNVRAALDDKPRGRLVLLESVLQPANQPDLGKLIDLEMLTMPGGRERTADEFGDLLSRAGFTLSRIVPNESPLSVIEGHPK